MTIPTTQTRPEPEQRTDGWPTGYPGPMDFGLGSPGMNLCYKPVLWQSEDLTRLEGSWLSGGQTPWFATGLSRHLALVEPGDLFVAWASTSDEDDHHRVAEAWTKGAVAAIVSRVPPGLPPEFPLFLVGDTEQAIAHLGHLARTRTRGVIIGITGSVGKTSTKEILHLMLSRFGPTSATWHNDNSEKGVPLALAQMPPNSVHAVLEVGMHRDPGAFAEICAGVRPNVALITGITAEHLAEQGGLAAVAANKASLLTALAPGGLAVLPRDSEYFPYLEQRAKDAPGFSRILSFGRRPEADMRVIQVQDHGWFSEVVVAWEQKKLRFRLNLPGAHQVMNAAAALTVAHGLGLDVAVAAASMAQLQPCFRRGRLLEANCPAGRVLLYDDTFSASPASMEAACATFARLENPRGGRKIMILGGMWGLGELSAHYHRKMAAEVNAVQPDLVYTLGDLTLPLQDALPARLRGCHFPTVASLVKALPLQLQDGDFLLLKGSLRLDLWKIAAALFPWHECHRHTRTFQEIWGGARR